MAERVGKGGCFAAVVRYILFTSKEKRAPNREIHIVDINPPPFASSETDGWVSGVAATLMRRNAFSSMCVFVVDRSFLTDRTMDGM